MNTQFKKLGTFVGLAVLSASISIGIAGCPKTTTDNQNNGTTNNNGTKTQVVKIDANLPMTGFLAIYGTTIKDGAVFALDDLAKSDPNGPKLKFDWQDNAGKPQTSVSVLQKQLLDKPDIYVSGIKPQAMAIKDKIDAQGLPNFIWIFDAFVNKNSSNNFRTWVNYKIEPPVYLNYVKEIGAKRVAIVYLTLPHSTEEFNNFVIPGLKKQGITDLLVEPFDLGKGDFKDVAVKLQQFKPDLIILNGFQNDLVAMVRAFRPFDLIKENNTIATYDMLDAATVLGAEELENIRFVSPLFVTRPDRQGVKEWKERFKAKYNREPLYTDAFAYDMVQIIHDTAKRLTLPATSEQWIKAIKTTNIEGITGTLKFDEDGSLITPLEVGVFKNGKPVPLKP
jgi:branched-chain amino acid transport system substrate-binding protein